MSEASRLADAIKLASLLERSPRYGTEKDEPEGARCIHLMLGEFMEIEAALGIQLERPMISQGVVSISDTLAVTLAERLRKLAAFENRNAARARRAVDNERLERSLQTTAKVVHIDPNPNLQAALGVVDALRKDLEDGKVIGFLVAGFNAKDETIVYSASTRPASKLRLQGAMGQALHDFQSGTIDDLAEI